MGKKIDVLSGDRWHFLTIIRETETKLKRRTFLCQCDCGNISERDFARMRNGTTTSCGCKSCKITKHGHSVGGKTTPEYYSWFSMKQRCQNEKHPNYHRYGGRGIEICDRWNSFSGFLEDMGKRPTGKTLDRIDNNKGYFKENCKWSTATEQGNNRINSVFIEYKGEKKTISQWAREKNMPDFRLRCRIKRGWSVERAIETT